MPCVDSRPSAYEESEKKAVTLLDYVSRKLDLERPKELVEAIANPYATPHPKPGGWSGTLCDLLRGMDTDIRDGLMYSDPRDVTQRALANWWERHLENDRRREQKEAEEVRKAALRRSAASKLTPEERAALGLGVQ